MYKRALVTGAALAGLSVILGAFGAHALKAMLPEDQLRIFETGVRYQFYHSIALILVGILYAQLPVKLLRIATTMFLMGIVLFSGSLYLMTLISTRGIGLGPIGILTPIGGLLFIGGWLSMMMAVLKGK